MTTEFGRDDRAVDTTQKDAESGAPGRAHLILVTGLSGAGRSSALAALEDMGFTTADNVPLALIGDLLDRQQKPDSGPPPVAIGVDSRTSDFDADAFEKATEALGQRDDYALHVLFMRADEAVLVQRYSETRRRHPLARGQQRLLDAIRREAALMHRPLKLAGTVIDTSGLTVAETKARIGARFHGDASGRLAITVMSFGFKHGSPIDADIMLDVRFLQNPHYDLKLREKTGKDADVARFVSADPDFEPFLEKTLGLLAFLLPRYAVEGKAYLTLAFGCTGGKHRSVMMAEAVGEHLDGGNFPVKVFHRDITD